jgi:hypothetical protein
LRVASSAIFAAALASGGDAATTIRSRRWAKWRIARKSVGYDECLREIDFTACTDEETIEADRDVAERANACEDCLDGRAASSARGQPPPQSSPHRHSEPCSSR